MTARFTWAGVGLFAASAAFGQDLGLDLTTDVDTGKPKLSVKLDQDLKDAVLYVDEVEIGPLPMDPVPVSKGEHTVTVQRPGYADFTQKVTAKKGVVQVTATLTATGEALHLTSDPDGADIVADGKGQGKTPKTISLSPGRHDLRLLKDGYQDWTYTIFTRAGRDEEVNAELKPLQQRSLTAAAESEQVDPDLLLKQKARESGVQAGGWYSHWYVWAGAAVVVAAVATGVAVAASQKGLDPSKVCGGPCDVTVNP